MRIAQILYDKAHRIFEAEEIPEFPPGPEGEPIELIDITKVKVEEGYLYDRELGVFIQPEPENIMEASSVIVNPLEEIKELQYIQLEASVDIFSRMEELEEKIKALSVNTDYKY